MSKEELNNENSNSQTETVSADSTFNTQQIIKPDLTQESSKSNQFSNETDRKINTVSSCENQDSNLISEDLRNANKHEDSGSVNENSALDIGESTSLKSANNQSQSKCNTEFKPTESTNFEESETQDSVSKQKGEDLEHFVDAVPTSELGTETGRRESQESIISETLQKSELHTETGKCENHDNIITEIEKSDEDVGGQSANVEGEGSAENINRNLTDLCKDSGPYLSRPQGTDIKKEENNVQEDRAEAPKILECQSEAKQGNSEVSVDSQGVSDNIEEQINDKDTVNKVSDEQERDTEVDKTETETYEDDFEETTEDDQNESTKDHTKVNIDSQEHTNIYKGDDSCVNTDKSEINTDEINEVSETNVVDTRVSEELTNENTDTDRNYDCKITKSVNKDSEEKGLTEILIDEEGIPKIAVTTVPDRPPSSLASDTGNADPFEDFQFDTKSSDSNKMESNGTEDIQHTADTNKVSNPDAEKEGKENFNRVVMETSDNDEIIDARQEKGEKNKPDDDNRDLDKTNEQSSNNDMNESVNEEEKSEEKIDMEATVDDAYHENKEGRSISEIRENEQRTKASIDSVGSQNNELPKDANDSVSDKIADKENANNDGNTLVNKTEERSKSPEPVSVPKHESPLEQMLRRNVTIDGTVDSVTQLESNVTTLLASMKDVMKYYSDLLKLQALKDFTNDLGKFRGDFTSINEAFKSCNSMSLNINQHLKDLRHITEDVRAQFHRKFQQEDLSTWIDLPAEQEKEKERLQEETVAAERAAMAKAAEARQAVAKAINGVAEAHQLIAEMETQAADAEAISQKAAAHARSALIAAEEARVAAEERRRAEEAAKKRAEERARIKAAEEEKKKALEEMKIYQDAAAKGTSVEDERRSFLEEKKRKELEMKNPKNWPRFSYKTEGIDFNPSVGCIIRAIEGSMREADVTCSYVDQSKGVLTLTSTEELVSNIIDIKQIEEDRTFSFEEPLSIALPVCIGRLPSGKETVVKQMMPNGAWREIPSADVQFEDYRELKFVEGRCTKFGSFVVVLRPKKDTLQFQKKGSKVLCSSDTRISFTNKPGTFKQNINAVLEVQTLDTNVVPDLKMRSPKECEALLCASPFIKFSMPVKNFQKPLTVSLPLPQVQIRQKRPATGISRETKSQDLRPSTARPSPTTEDDANEQIFFLHRDDKTFWTVNTKMKLVQPKTKDTVTFDITQSYQRMILLRTKAGKSVAAVEKMATLLENMTTQRNVKVIARQRNDDVADVMVTCTSSNRAERTLKYMEEHSFTEGPNPSPDIVLREGQQLYMKFRGNMECISENPSLSFIYNTNIRATREFRINEKEEFAQKSLPSFRGFVQIFTKALVPKPIAEGAPKNVQPEMVEAEVLLTELLVELPKPEAEPPKPLATAPLILKEGPLTSGVLRYIAGMLGKEWKDVAAQLNLKPMRIQAILRNHVNKDTAETRYDMLVTWAKRVPKAVDKVQILYNALIACGRPDIAEEVRHRGQQYKQQRFMNARVSHLRQAFVKVAKTTAVFNRWKTFAKDIGVPEEQIKRIDEAGGSGQEKCYTSLETWKDAVGEEATVTSLATYLKTAKEDRLSRDVQTLVAS